MVSPSPAAPQAGSVRLSLVHDLLAGRFVSIRIKGDADEDVGAVVVLMTRPLVDFLARCTARST